MRLLIVSFLLIYNGSALFAGNLQIKDSLVASLSQDKAPEENLQTIQKIFNELEDIESLNFWVRKAEPILASCEDENAILRFKIIEGGFRLTWYDYEKGMSVLHEALKTAELLKDSSKMAAINYRIGAHYFYLQDFEKSISYIQASIDFTGSAEDQGLYANRIMALGVAYCEIEEIDKGIAYQLEAVAILQKHKKYHFLPVSLNNLAEAYSIKKNNTKALELIDRSIKIADSLVINDALYYAQYLKGKIYQDEQEYRASIPYLEAAVNYWEQSFSNKDLPQAYETILVSYKALNKNVDAIETLEKLVVINESFFNSRELNASKDIEAKYESEKKELELIKEKQEREWAQKENELTKKSERQNLYIFVIISLFLIISIIYLYIRFKNQRRDKNTILNQKQLIEIRSQEIEDSINYAKRLQSAIMPTVAAVESSFENAFVMYRPKDIVAGDFFWMDRVEDTLLIAAADCTGHGVPGAMVSVVCTNGLNSAVRQHGLVEPKAILDKARDIVVKQFAKSGENVKDGMDISLCSIQKNILKFSGANNPLWLARKNENTSVEDIERRGSLVGQRYTLIETKGDKQPIGLSDQSKPFTQAEIKLLPGDVVYLLTDGYADQFGGLNEGVKNPGGKKFKYSRLKKLLLDNCEKPFEQQHSILNEAFTSWQGDLEQLDDVCLIGLGF